MKILTQENILKGSWDLKNGLFTADETSKRINKLVKEFLTEIGEDESGWCKLYQDPKDGRYWELSYPESELQGGGPPQLKNISLEEARKQYKI